MDNHATLGTLVGDYADQQIAVILDAQDPLLIGSLDAVHPTRVAIRRLRSVLRTFDGVYRRGPSRRLDDELRWLANALGEARDVDVAHRRLTAALRSTPDRPSAQAASAALSSVVAQRSRAAWVHLGAALGSRRYARLRSTLADWRDDPPLRDHADLPADEALHHVAAADAELRRLIDRAVRAASRGHDSTARRVHSARKAGKRHRYAVELALPVLGDSARSLVDARAALQDLLGEQQDAVLTREFIAEVRRSAPPQAGPALDEALRREDLVVAGAAQVLARYSG
ncbi:CHAD domain-containing protein [Gordonia crocea]|uniref:CHAD domain-containing protein n=1 Tax=Gordonia crocea TaxID=589162 RepID=A0A7I9UVJ2_9ACTN|nr:CHAD domain-containing protein [Gordonia crocea]GED96780.1 hypothetical protein nbrc107697_08190 [Gordonia crocea]